MGWVFILVAGMFETAWPFILKRSTSAWIPLAVACFAIPIMYLLDQAMKRDLPAGTVYAAFVGIGTASTALVGMIFFKESTNVLRILCLLLIIVGSVGLRLFSGSRASG
jgi:quaternary ammonium compound-resistance protein SugE